MGHATHHAERPLSTLPRLGIRWKTTKARLWYHLRAGVFVSEVFIKIEVSFIVLFFLTPKTNIDSLWQDPKPLVRLILVLTLVNSEHFVCITQPPF